MGIFKEFIAMSQDVRQQGVDSRLEKLTSGSKLPAHWSIEALPNGTWRLVQSDEGRLKGWAIGLSIAVVMGALIQVMIVGLFHEIPKMETAEAILKLGMFVLVASPFIAVCLACTYLVVWSLMGEEEWIVSRHQMELRKRWKSSKQHKSCFYTDAQGQLELHYLEPDSDSSESWRLDIWCPNNHKNYRARLASTSGSGSDCSTAELQSLGAALSEITAWPLLIRGQKEKPPSR